MRDRTELRAFELADKLTLSKRLGFLPNEDSLLIEPKVIETEKALNGLMRPLRDAFMTFSLQPKHLTTLN